MLIEDLKALVVAKIQQADDEATLLRLLEILTEEDSEDLNGVEWL